MLFEHSRHSFCEMWSDSQSRLFLDARRPYRYRAFTDNLIHTVEQGETIWTIAGKHFRPHERAAGLWWVVADFQPLPIHDPTIRLTPGMQLVLPSLRTVVEIILNENRQVESRL